MKAVGYFLFACVLLTLLQTALSVLVVVGLIAVLFGIFYHPAETFGFLAFGLLANLFQAHPIAAVWLVSLFVMAGIVVRLAETKPHKPLYKTCDGLRRRRTGRLKFGLRADRPAPSHIAP